MGMLIIRRRPHLRRAFVRKDGVRVRATRVKGSVFRIKDRGSLGRGPRVIPPLRKGTLGVSFSSPASVRRKKEIALAKRIGERRVIAKLRALQVLNKRINPSVAAKAKADARFIAGSFIGRKKVRFGTRFRRKRRIRRK